MNGPVFLHIASRHGECVVQELVLSCCSQKRTKSVSLDVGEKQKKKNQNSPNPCAASAMITSAEHGCSVFVLSLFFLLVLVLFAHVVVVVVEDEEDANSRRRAGDDDSSLRSMMCTFSDERGAF